MKMILISAVAENGLIGRANDLPWKISQDLKFFKATTLDHVMLMGSNTWRSFGSRCLPRRHHVVASRKPGHISIHPDDGGRVTIADLENAIVSARIHAKNNGQDQFFVIGGGEIYKQTIDRADELVLTRVHRSFDVAPGDVFFPEIGPEWEIVSQDERQATDDGLEFTLNVVYRRR